MMHLSRAELGGHIQETINKLVKGNKLRVVNITDEFRLNVGSNYLPK